MQKQLYSTGEIANELGTYRWVIIHLVESKKVQEPMRIGGKRIFTQENLEEIAKILSERKQNGCSSK